MKKQPFCWLIGLFLAIGPTFLNAQSEEPNEAELLEMMDSLNRSFRWETGLVSLKNGLATVNVPAGFKFLNGEQSRFVLENLWGNPPDESTLGMLFPEKSSPLDSSVFAFNLSFDSIGYVKDTDAGDINYTDLLKQVQEESAAANAERVKLGYEPIKIIGWANPPFYDAEKKVLHWAKEIQFGEPGAASENTLNYDVRVLGRKGVLSMNAVGGMSALPSVKASIADIVASASFGDGSRYADFDSNVDEVAAWTIGGLVAGKVLAKAGFFAIFLKFLKPILLILGGGAAAFFSFFRKKKGNWLA